MAKSPSRSDRLSEILRRPDLPYSITAEWVAHEITTAKVLLVATSRGSLNLGATGPNGPKDS
jgi:hypothetical protein